MTITFYCYREKYFIESVLLWPRALWASDNSLSIPKQAFSSFSSPWELCRKVTCKDKYRGYQKSTNVEETGTAPGILGKKRLSYLGLCFQKKTPLFPDVRSGLSIVSIPRAPDSNFFYSSMYQAQETLERCRQLKMAACSPDVKH